SAGGGSLDDYPTIDPTSFDVVLCGTGLPESILAAACAAAGKTVLHVDPDAFYGSFYSSIPLPSVPSFLSADSSTPCPSSTTASSSATAAYTAVDLKRRSLYSEVETSGTVPEPSRRFTVDLVGGSHHVEFKSVEGGSLIYWDGALCPVPDSRQAIFMDSTHRSKEKLNLRDNLKEKTLLFRFFKLVQSHIAASSPGDKDGEGEASGKISEEDLDLPFIEFLKKQQLQPKIRAFANAQGAFIYPMYGHGELPQAFCRFAAVKGALYVLRMPVTALLVDQEKKRYIGTRLASGQDILCQQLILGPSYKIPSLDMPSDASDSNLTRKVARGVCIISSITRAASYSCSGASAEQQCSSMPSWNTSDDSEGHLETTSKNIEDTKPVLIWSCVYVQEITQILYVFVLRHPLSRLPLSGNIWYCIVMPHA
uniref:Rab proteins geranylgeranyltransferase component n=1 Tax=Aegilops tauschii subsp. strangulata TaxID=200361 RepID=A0A453EQ87_AEGTS